MKFKIPPSQFKSIVNAGMFTRYIDPILATFTPDGITIKSTHSNAMSVQIELDKALFSLYECEKSEPVTISSIVLERLSWGFPDDEITISTKKDHLHLDGSNDHFDTIMDVIKPEKSMFKAIKTERGLIPIYNFDGKLPPENPEDYLKNLSFPSAIELDASDLKLPSSSAYLFELKGNKISVTIPGSGNFIHNLKGKLIGKNPAKSLFDGDYYSSIIPNLSGPVTFIFDENVAVFIENSKNHRKTYALASRFLDEDAK